MTAERDLSTSRPRGTVKGAEGSTRPHPRRVRGQVDVFHQGRPGEVQQVGAVGASNSGTWCAVNAMGPSHERRRRNSSSSPGTRSPGVKGARGDSILFGSSVKTFSNDSAFTVDQAHNATSDCCVCQKPEAVSAVTTTTSLIWSP